MVTSAKATTDDAVPTAADRSSKSLPNRSAQVTDRDIARRAHDLCLARGCGPGRDVVDWMEVERELSSQTSDAARLLNRFGPHERRSVLLA